MKVNVLIVLIFMLFVGPVFAAVNQCVKLNPDTVCTAVTGAKYNVTDTSEEIYTYSYFARLTEEK